MEAKISENGGGSISTPVTPTNSHARLRSTPPGSSGSQDPKPITVTPRTSESGYNSSRKARHRRSMSDPNLQKHFREVKKIWDQKVKSGKFAQVFSCDVLDN